MLKCPVCKKSSDSGIVEPYGPVGHILVAGEFPGVEEINRGIPFVGSTGKILAEELGRAGISIESCRLTNLWLHLFLPYMTEEEGHIDWHLSNLLDEIAQANYILLMGSELSKMFLKESITNVNGLMMPSPLFPSDTVATFSVNPASVAWGVVGEFRLAVEKFAERALE